MSIEPFQIRAARGLLGWSQTELAQRAGTSLSAVADCEKERGRTSRETYDRFLSAFERESVFITATGVEKRNTGSYEIAGPEWWLEALDDVYYTLMDEGGELLLMFSDDRESSKITNDRIRKIRNAGIKMRQLVREDNKYMMGPANEYKWIPKEYFLNYVTLIYGDKVAVCAEDNSKAIVSRDLNLANTWRNIFDMLWNGVKLIEPAESTANERF